ncbi:MAG: zf-HC2 domain-containing protein [Desulfobacteraceae bacterium]|nr:zf-HC2 domain-containing protein [Desulfobacteraceae bacterium]
MKKTCTTYDKKIISEFVDNELSSEENKKISEHIKTCPICKNISEEYIQMSNAFVQRTSIEVEKINTGSLGENVLKQIKRKENGFSKKVFDYFSPKLYLKIASLVAIMVVSLIYFQAQPVNIIGPSAIVNSVDGNASSIMILETEKSKHTIIWFSET